MLAREVLNTPVIDPNQPADQSIYSSMHQILGSRLEQVFKNSSNHVHELKAFLK